MRLIFHAGTHKTGTTTIQKSLLLNQSWLRENKLFYPTSQPFPPHRSHLVFSRALASEADRDKQRCKRFIDAVKREARPDETVIFSAEPVYRMIAGDDGFAGLVGPDYWDGRRRYLEELAKVLSGFEVEILLYFRDYEYFLTWLHRVVTRENVWQGSVEDFKKDFGDRFAYDKQIALFEEFFPVKTASYEDAKSSGLVRHFYNTISFPAPSDSDSIWERPTAKRHMPDSNDG